MKPFAEKEDRIKKKLRSALSQWKQEIDQTAVGIQNVRSKRIAILVFIVLLVTASVICYFTLGKQLLIRIGDKQAFKDWLDSFGIWGKLIFVSIRTLQTVVKFIPAEPLEIGAGYAFGTWGGLLYCSIGSLLGSLIILLLTKKFGIKLVRLFISQKKLRSFAFLQNKRDLNTTLFIVYLIPSTPKDMITYLIGLTDESIPLFLLITAVARIPSIVTSTWCGSSLRGGNYLMSAVIFIATAVLGIGGGALYSRISGREKNEKVQTKEEKIA